MTRYNDNEVWEVLRSLAYQLLARNGAVIMILPHVAEPAIRYYEPSSPSPAGG
jgi:hypothetical protein